MSTILANAIKVKISPSQKDRVQTMGIQFIKNLLFQNFEFSVENYNFVSTIMGKLGVNASYRTPVL